MSDHVVMRAGPAWIEAVRVLGGAATPDSTRELEARYAESHRRYHATAHVEAVLDYCAWLGRDIGLSPFDGAVVAAAACAHDIVYNADPGEDERASAAWVRVALTASGVAAAAVRRVERLVLLTMTHASEGDAAAGVLLDADLAILGASADAYDGYVAGVRAEYGSVPDDAWRRGRTEVLTALLAREPLFATAAARRRWEDAARANVRRELETLT